MTSLPQTPITPTDGPAGALARAILDHSRQRPSSTALVWGEERISYARLAEMAAHARAVVDGLALPEGAAVGVLARKSPAAVALILACLTARHPFLLPSVDLGSGALDTLLDRAGCSAVLSAGAGDGAGHDGIATRVVSSPAGATPGGPDPLADPDPTTFMLTTSGSTGLPKVVPLSAGAVDRFTDWAAAAFDLGPGTGVLNYAPLNFDLCLLDVWATLKAGGCAVLVDQDRAADPRYLVGLLRRNRVHVVQAVPMLYQLLLEAHDGRGFEGVRHVISTGASLPRRTIASLPALFSGARFYNLYGCTETNDSFVHELDEQALESAGTVPIGTPLPGVSALVANDDGTVLAGPGTGELWVSTPFQTRGYLGAANDAKFVRAGAGGPQRDYFRTGDLVQRHDDGAITLVGRNDFQVKVRGVAVNLEEVERAMLEHDGVLEAAVVAVPDDVAGNRLQALVRCRPGAAPDTLALRQYCAARLPRAALPSAIKVTEQALPRTSTGKVDRKQLMST